MPNSYQGRQKIVIPISLNQFNSNPIEFIKHYLQKCIAINNENKQEIEQLYNIYKGDHDIKNKVRLDGSSENNNKLVYNHIFRQVEFKKGFMVGKPIEYSKANNLKNDTDDMTYLQKYFKDSHKASKDIDKYEMLYIGGIANVYTMPRNSDFDVENESPFLISILEKGQGFVVYTSDVTNEPLFNVIVSEHVEKVNGIYKKETIYDIYYIKEEDGYCYTFSISSRDFKNIIDNMEYQQTYKFLPITEFSLNRSRMGIVELVISIQNMLNTTRSNQVDELVEFVNSYIVFENQNFKSQKFMETFEELKKKRVLGLTSVNPNFPAKVSLLKQELQNQDINSVYNDSKNEMYDIVAVPLSSGNVTSGGDTGQARLLGNGWESAQTQADVDTTFLMQYEYDLLKKIISICKDCVGCPINEISASDIDIKFSINMSNNLLNKAQALKYMYDMNMPKEEALIMTGITGDTHGVSQKWESKDNQMKQEELNNEIAKNNITNNNNNNDSN